MALHLRVDVRANLLSPRNGKTFTFDEFLQAVGGCMEVIEVWDGRRKGLLLVDTDGYRHGRPLNGPASDLAGVPVRGDALLVSQREFDACTVCLDASRN